MKKRGFTLIELLAVIVITGILTTIILISISTLLEKNKKNFYKTLEQNLIVAGKEYYNKYPDKKPKSYNNNLSKITFSDLNTEKYISKIYDYSGKGTCTGNVVAYLSIANNKVNYYACFDECDSDNVEDYIGEQSQICDEKVISYELQAPDTIYLPKGIDIENNVIKSKYNFDAVIRSADSTVDKTKVEISSYTNSKNIKTSVSNNNLSNLVKEVGDYILNYEKTFGNITLKAQSKVVVYQPLAPKVQMLYALDEENDIWPNYTGGWINKELLIKVSPNYNSYTPISYHEELVGSSTSWKVVGTTNFFKNHSLYNNGRCYEGGASISIFAMCDLYVNKTVNTQVKYRSLFGQLSTNTVLSNETKNYSIMVDKTPPTITITKQTTKNGPVKFKITDNDSGIKSYYIEYGKYKTTPIVLSANTKISEKEYTFTHSDNNKMYIIAYDNAGNEKKMKFSYTYTQEQKPTLNKPYIYAADTWTNYDQRIWFSRGLYSTDLVNYYYCQTSSSNGCEPNVLSGVENNTPKIVISNSGISYVNVKACYKDNSGCSDVSNIAVVLIDKIPPQITSVYNPVQGRFVNYDYQISMNAKDEHSGIEYYYYSYDQKSWTKYNDSYGKSSYNTTPFSAERNQFVYFVVKDKAGNTSSSVSTKIMIDKTPPIININRFDGGGTGRYNISFTVVDSLSGTDVYEWVYGVDQYYAVLSDLLNNNWGIQEKAYGTTTDLSKSSSWNRKRNGVCQQGSMHLFVGAKDIAGNAIVVISPYTVWSGRCLS